MRAKSQSFSCLGYGESSNFAKLKSGNRIIKQRMANIEQDILQICEGGNPYLLRNLKDPKGLDVLLEFLINHTHQDRGWCICRRISYNIYDMPIHLRNKFIDLVRENDKQFAGNDKFLALRKRFAPKKQISRSEATNYLSYDRKTRLCPRGYLSEHIDRTIEEACMPIRKGYSNIYIFNKDTYIMKKISVCDSIY